MSVKTAVSEKRTSQKVQKKSAGAWAFDIFLCIVYGLFTLACIFPFYYIFINTISDNNLVATGRITLLPKGVHLQNYVNVLKLKIVKSGGRKK